MAVLQHPSPSPSPSPSSPRSARHVPLLSLALPALALGDRLTLGEPGDDANVGEIWNVITRAADLVKDGERLENLAWRHWGQPRHNLPRRSSTSSLGSSMSTLYTPATERSSYSFCRSKSCEKRSFGGALKLLLEDDSNFKDWVEEAKKHSPIPAISVPETPVANVEIRLVEPTPVPSRVGSLGASMATAGGLLNAAVVPPKLNEEDEEEEIITEEPVSIQSRSPRKRGKFFVHSSPTKGSGSDTSQPSLSSVVPRDAPVGAESHSTPASRRSFRKASVSSQGEKPKKTRMKELADQPPRRNVSLSTMRGKFQAEKRRIAETLAAKEEDSGWEDEDVGSADTEGSEDENVADHLEDDGDWSDEDAPKEASPAHPRRSHNDLAHLFAKSTRKAHVKPSPPPPAPTPLRHMTKEERIAAKAERARIETELEAQRKREMFAKQQIFGKASGSASGLLSGLFKTGGSMVDLTQAPQTVNIRSSPTHGNLPSMKHTPSPAPSLLRSKSVVAVPVQTGVSVTVSPQGMEDVRIPKTEKGKHRGESRSSNGSQERSVPEGVEMESSDESEEEDNYLATSSTQRKLAELVAKKEAKTQPVAAVRFDESGRAEPSSPTTRRRNIIMREMSVSLRQSLIQERKTSAPLIGRQASFGQQRPSTSRTSPLERHRSESHIESTHPSPPQPPARRGNILGSGFLRPLTRVPTHTEHTLTRAQSTANLSSDSTQISPTAQPMARSSTDEGGFRAVERAAHEEYARRHPDLHMNYRTHGW